MGIGGIGMSALARYFLARGVEVMGSDSSDSEIIHELQEEGATIFRDHRAENVPHDIYQLVYSEAISSENPERQFALEHDIPQKSYFSAVGDISRARTTISICGTHGKSTTTAMAGLALENVSDPLVILGTRVFEWGKKNIRIPSALCGNGGCAPDFFCVESCEYRDSFLHLSPDIIVVTNCEPDHLDWFKTPENYFHAFRKFAKKLPPNGILIADFSDPKIADLFSDLSVQKINSADFREQVPVLALPGAHLRENASKVLALFSALHLPLSVAREALDRFHGTWRRFEKKGEKEGVIIFDDYAHHPTEIRATLRAFREQFPENRLFAVFQPHQFSRTREFFEEFVTSFQDADRVLIPNIYKVRDTEADEQSVSAENLAKRIGEKATWTQDFEKTVLLLKQEAKKGDVIVTLGAGPVFEVGQHFLDSTD